MAKIFRRLGERQRAAECIARAESEEFGAVQSADCETSLSETNELNSDTFSMSFLSQSGDPSFQFFVGEDGKVVATSQFPHSSNHSLHRALNWENPSAKVY